ncbi:MAG: hypothetical protein C5B54_00965 [Acidobacteria bacterium]|nr:MAG: hypothetical protein C5B54_00965 [Acidobacteriota bacterium]
MRRFLLILTLISLSSIAQAATDNGCWFLRMNDPRAPKIVLPAQTKSVVIENYFHIFYSAGDLASADLVARQQETFSRSKHLLQTEMGWRLPVSRKQANEPELDIYFIAAPKRFTGTVTNDKDLAIILNKDSLASNEFAALWMHQLAHAAELQYKAAGDYWFYEATAGWMEGLISPASSRTIAARQLIQDHPEFSLTNSQPVAALGASRFVEMLSRPYRDLVRQIWDQWSFDSTDTLIEVVSKTLELNHLPDFDSYLQNYFLGAHSQSELRNNSLNVALLPFSAAVLRGTSDQANGGAHVSFTPDTTLPYAAGLLFYTRGEGSGSAVLKKGLSQQWSVLVPYNGLEHFDVVVVNTSPQILRGKIQRDYDSAIPGVLEYFRVNPGDSGVQIEWKTSREDGVAFWNLYRLDHGTRQLLNDFPIPASINSEQGVHYLYLDSSDGAFYSLEAITADGLASPFASAEAPK